ncbi:8830_t:CDS:2 [Entrophospora sp. SA101]|nr:8830_t:CDS:2 [Entrophospora sp. SA101]
MSSSEFTSLNEFFDSNSLPILIEDNDRIDSNSFPILVEDNDQIDSILEFDEFSFQESMNDAINIELVDDNIEENLSMKEFDKVTPCVIIDNDKNGNKIERCNCIDRNRSISNLSGSFEIDSGAVKEVGEDIQRLDDINAKNKLLNLLIQVFKDFNTEVSTKPIVQDFTSTESIVEESSIPSNNLIVPRPTLFLLSVAFRVNKMPTNENLQSNKSQTESYIKFKRKQRKLPPPVFNETNLIKLTTFLASVILTFAFPNAKIWLTQVMSSLCQKPRLMPYLYSILQKVHVISHTRHHENRNMNKRISRAVPASKLKTGRNIWNLAVIDNIDIKDHTFSYGNIFDVTRNTSHATLRMVFQFDLPDLPMFQPTIKEPLFSENSFVENWIEKFNNVFDALYNTYIKNFYKENADISIQQYIISIRTGNLELQLKSLNAFAPLFPITGKSRYAESLQVAASINLTRENHYLGYDEALETFGVKERLLILYDEYVDDISTSRNIRTMNDRNEALWKLVDKLLETFNDSSPEECPMFTEAKQLTTKAEVSEMSIQQPEISNQIEEDVPVPSTSNLTLLDPIVI